MMNYDDIDFVSCGITPGRCHLASKRVISTEEYRKADKVIAHCVEMLKSKGYDEFQIMDLALANKDTIQFMFEEACYKQGFKDAIEIIKLL